MYCILYISYIIVHIMYNITYSIYYICINTSIGIIIVPRNTISLYTHTHTHTETRAIAACACCAETSNKMRLDRAGQRAPGSLRTHRNHGRGRKSREGTTDGSFLNILEDVTLNGHKESWILCTAILIDYSTLENTKEKMPHVLKNMDSELWVWTKSQSRHARGRGQSVWHPHRWWFPFIKIIM